MYIINGNIITMENEDYDCGYVKIEDGKISDVGLMLKIDDISSLGDDVIDASGCVVMPGLIDAHTHLGIFGSGLGFEGEDGNEDTDPATPQLRVIDAVNPMDRCFSEACSAGVTTAMISPGSSNPIGGQASVFKLFGKCADDMAVRSPAAIKFALGENPKMSYHDKEETPVTRMATAAIIREQLYKAKEYLEAKKKAEKDEDAEKPDFDIKCESLIPLLEGRIDAHFHAHRADDICTAIRIANEFHIKCVLIHATEGHLISDIIAKANIPVITGPALGFRSKPELTNMSFETPGRLALSGVTTAISTDHPEVSADMLFLCAAMAIKGGMPLKEALKAITINPAKILGIDANKGSLKAGKDADIVILNGDPLDIKTTAKYVFVNGKIAYNK